MMMEMAASCGISICASSCHLSKLSRIPALVVLSSLGLILLCCQNAMAATTVVGFYDKSCPAAESTVRAVVQNYFSRNQTIAPALLRMLFHDAFVRGAEASILLDSTPTNESEKHAGPNLTIRGFDLIDAAKEAVESKCPGIVSCADIIVLATRDAVELAGGPKFAVRTGRLDGKVSLKEEALTLPSPSFPMEQAVESFREKGLTAADMVTLLGAHTVGVALCGFFNDRLYNYHGTGAADPSMNAKLLKKLTGVCPNPFDTESDADPAVDLDQATPALFDTSYYTQLLAGNGILQLDQEIAADPLVAKFSGGGDAAFFPAFVASLLKLSDVGVILRPSPLGEVRRQCHAVNPQRPSALQHVT